MREILVKDKNKRVNNYKLYLWRWLIKKKKEAFELGSEWNFL